MMLGRVDEVDGHYIATKFVALLVPTGTMYVTGEKSSKATRGITMTWSGVPIQWNWKSLGLAYARVYLPVLGVAWPFVTHWGENVATIPKYVWVVSVALVAASFLFLIPGKLPEEEKARLRILGSITGMRIDPGKLREATRQVKRDSLGALMEKGGIPTTPDDIIAVLDDIPGPALPLVYAYACYAGDDEAWRACAAQVHERCKQNEL
jgi:hypothetical protein